MKRGVTVFALVAMSSLDAHSGASAFELKSPDISAGTPIGMKFVSNVFGCAGENLSPELAWSEPPAGTKSFAVLAHDPDAPTGGAGFWHWLVADIPASARSLPRGAGDASGKKLPAGARQWENDYGEAAYGGPCPPPGHGAHRYNFTVYALGIDKLGLPAHAKPAAVGFVINQNALAKATITSRYGR
jgi:Raf kinase inhibitor-like YbhB/YbcL family protein